MKKFISVMLAAILSITSIGAVCTVSAQNETETAPLSTGFVSQLTQNGSKIPNTYAKIKSGQDINLGYFGGSVTNGYGPANPPYNESESRQGIDCWRGLSKVWLNETYGIPNGITIRENNSNYAETYGEDLHAGLGGTGVDLNLYRADRFLGLSSGDPVDLLFIEFAINDAIEKNTYEKSAFFMESCIKMIREKSPQTDIVVILTTDHTKLVASNGGTTLHKNAQAHADVAEYYGIPWFWFGEYMYDFLVEQNGGSFPASDSAVWQTYMADGCHPSVQGYAKYFEFLKNNFLVPNLDDTKGYSTEIVNYTTPATPYNTTEKFLTQHANYEGNINSVYYNQRLRTDAYMVSPGEVTNFGAEGYGYEISNPGTANVYLDSSYMKTSNPGMSFTIKFNSRNAGMFYKGHPTMGLIQYRVDGGAWEYYNMYLPSRNQNEYFMFYENKVETEHTVDVILRKTGYGSELELRGFFIEGDSTNYGAALAEGAPNNAPLNDEVSVPVVLAPTDFDTVINDWNGASFSVYHLGVIDKDVLRYTPNPASNKDVASSCYNENLHKVTLPRHKYAVIRYYYELQPGTTEAHAVGARPFFIMTQKLTPTSGNLVQHLNTADKIVLGGETANELLLDISALYIKNNTYDGYIHQFYMYPFGWCQGNDLVATELMNIESITFYEEYPYTNEYNINVAVNKNVSSTAQTVSLSGKRVLPSAHKYATVKYTASEDATLTLKLSIEDSTDTFTVTNTVRAGSGEAIVNLEKIANSGQMFFYDNVEFTSNKAIDIESITFSVDYPAPDVDFAISFDANGGEGTVPEPIYGKAGDEIQLPDSSLEIQDKIFLGWSTEKDGSNIITNVVIPAGGVTLYAAYADVSLLTYNLNGGSGNVPTQVKVAVGKETSLMTADITKGNSVFLGWGTSPDATTTVDKITMDADGVTVYAIFKDLQTVYVAADGALTYKGTPYTANYRSMSEALSALGRNGGHIVFEGIFPGTNAIGVSGAPLYIFEGADNTAGLTFTGYTVNINCNLTLKNLAFIRYSEDPYFYANGHKLVLGDGFGYYAYDDTASNKRGAEAALKGGLVGGKLILNDGILDKHFVGGTNSSNTSGNIYVEINGSGPHYNGYLLGAFSFKEGSTSYTHTGNATVVINGGSFANKKVLVDFSTSFPTTVTGATSVILNNGITGFTFDPKIEYIINSTVDGTVSLAADGSSQYAPTFFIKAKKPNSKILIDGVEMNSVDGEYLFMPKAKGTFNVTYEDKPLGIEFNVSIGNKSDTGKTVVDNELGFDGRAVLEIDGMDAIYLEEANESSNELTKEVALDAGTYNFKIRKPGYISYNGTLTVNDDGSIVMDEIPTLIAGDIRNHFGDNEGDGKVDLDDFVRVLRGFETNNKEKSLLRMCVDLDEDGYATVSDLAIIKRNFGKTANAYKEN